MGPGGVNQRIIPIKVTVSPIEERVGLDTQRVAPRAAPRPCVARALL